MAGGVLHCRAGASGGCIRNRNGRVLSGPSPTRFLRHRRRNAHAARRDCRQRERYIPAARAARVRTAGEELRLVRRPDAFPCFLTAAVPAGISQPTALDKGTPGETRGRKATGPRLLRDPGRYARQTPRRTHDRRAAEEFRTAVAGYSAGGRNKCTPATMRASQ
jgi:hypothetical protein